jgi:hypothetical protein
LSRKEIFSNWNFSLLDIKDSGLVLESDLGSAALILGYGNCKDPYLFFDVTIENHPTSFLKPATFATVNQW